MRNYFIATIKDGRLSSQEFARWIKTQKDGKIEIYCDRISGKRSTQQNRLFFSAICQQAADYQGNSKESWHRFFEEKFLGREWQTFGKERALIQKTCSMLDKNDFSDFIEECKLWLIENLDFVFPDRLKD